MDLGEGFEPPLPGPEPGVLPLDDPRMVGQRRIELLSADSKSAVFPLYDCPSELLEVEGYGYSIFVLLVFCYPVRGVRGE